MSAPSPIPGTSGPPITPAEIPVSVSAGGSGGSVGGLVVPEVRGFCIAFDSTTLAENPSWFRLDDPAGPFVVRDWRIDRGRVYELDKTGPGTAKVTLIDTSGAFDPTNASSFFAGKIQPMKQAAIALFNPVTDAWSTVFRGFVADWNYDMYVTEKHTTVTLDLVDAMDFLAATEMVPGFLFGPGPGFGDIPISTAVGDVYFLEDLQVADRINQILDEVGWPAGMREIFSGNVKLRATVYPVRGQALTVMQDAADAEFPGVANVYVQKNGIITFHGRLARFNPADVQYDIDIWRCGDKAAVDADSTRAPIFALGYQRGKTHLINSALSTPQEIADAGIVDQIVADETSMSTYGTRSVSFENLLTKQDYFDGAAAKAATKKFATYYVSNYKDPKTRVNRIDFRSLPPGDSRAQRVWALMAGVDISDIIRLKTTHPGGGGFDEDFYVEGCHFSARPLNSEYLDVTLSLDVSPRSYYNTSPWT